MDQIKCHNKDVKILSNRNNINILLNLPILNKKLMWLVN